MRKFDLSLRSSRSSYFATFRYFFQAEDGIRAHCVTGVQTCALPISTKMLADDYQVLTAEDAGTALELAAGKIGRASCRERVEISGSGLLAENEKIRTILAQLEKLLLCDL